MNRGYKHDRESVSKGDLVKIEGEEGVFVLQDITFNITSSDRYFLKRLGDREAVKKLTEEELKKVRPADLDEHEAENLIHRLMAKRVLAGPTGIKSFSYESDVIFKRYQFSPLLKYIEGIHNRLLIADETGLGKTIEASYIILRELARGSQRIAIICPSSLKRKWRDELYRRFGIHFDIVRPKGFKETLKKDEAFKCIVSMDCLAGGGEGITKKDFVSSIKDIDLTLIDEIHHMRNIDTLRNSLGMTMSHKSKGLIGLTASPIHTEVKDLYNIFKVINPRLDELCLDDFKELVDLANDVKMNRIDDEDSIRSYIDDIKGFSRDGPSWLSPRIDQTLDPEEIDKKELHPFSDVFNRTTRDEAGLDNERVVRPVSVKLNQENFSFGDRSISEKDLFKKLDELFKEHFHHPHRLQLYSSWPPMRGLLESGMNGDDYWSSSHSELPEAIKKKYGIKEEAESLDEKIKQRCESLKDYFDIVEKDSKYERLKTLLMGLKEDEKVSKVLVFTHWIPTMRYLKKKQFDLDVKIFYAGSENRWEEEDVLKDFENFNGFAVLIASDILSEGIDIQSANCVVNYDLPYNPQRLEQRIGRVDRVGQENDKIFVYNFFINDDPELDIDIRKKISERMKIFRNILGHTQQVTELESFMIGHKKGIDYVEEEETVLDKISELPMFKQMFDDKLDESASEIGDIYMSGKPYLISGLFEMFSEDGDIKIQKSESGDIGFVGLDKDLIETIVDMAEVKEKRRVRSFLESLKSGKKFDLVGEGENTFISIRHPIFKVSSRLISKRFSSTFVEDDENLELVALMKTEGIEKEALLYEVNIKWEGREEKHWRWIPERPEIEIDRLFSPDNIKNVCLLELQELSGDHLKEMKNDSLELGERRLSSWRSESINLAELKLYSDIKPEERKVLREKIQNMRFLQIDEEFVDDKIELNPLVLILGDMDDGR